ncbi:MULTISPECIES: potassium channel family protein [unclassified Shimia]|uniref:potassium channel family protein n=1 Tax=unclassified Shimia TaxID=2630038 RepID=UPI001ADBBDB7|nr:MULTISPECIES: potassium channel family protein [unclassified Shimia]MBO9472526.1 potassium channel family protein [Shimia sp. R10_1]MDA5556212.1 ion channel [Shimia sp. MMG029]
MDALKANLQVLYTAHSRGAVRFRYALIVFDFATILFFVAIAHAPHSAELVLLSRLAGVVIALDFLARWWIAEDRRHFLTRIYTLADVAVIVSLFVDPWLQGDLAFLRVLRGLRLIHSYHLLYDLRHDSAWFRQHEDTVIASINLFVFVMVTSATSLVFFIDTSQSTHPFIDAMYFTVATLTTTGYGDITLQTPGGKVFSICVMVGGVALFVQLAQAVIRPQKVRHKCQSCGLLRHEPDAVHCKHCGTLICIETEGG